MKKKIFYCLTFLIVCAFSCKKGENDPFISLRTRKARLSGEWHLASGNLTLSYKKEGKNDYSENYNFMENYFTGVNSATGEKWEGHFKFQISFTKDGDFSFLQLIGSSNLSGNGTWDFLKGVGDYKNKERLSFKSAAIGGGSFWIDTFNKSENYFIYNITELKNKKLVLETKEELMKVSNADSVCYYVTSKYTFVQ